MFTTAPRPVEELTTSVTRLRNSGLKWRVSGAMTCVRACRHMAFRLQVLALHELCAEVSEVHDDHGVLKSNGATLESVSRPSSILAAQPIEHLAVVFLVLIKEKHGSTGRRRNASVSCPPSIVAD